MERKRGPETEYKELLKRGDQKIEIIWNVSANPKYRYPGPFDRDLHKAIEEIIKETLRKNGEIKIPIYSDSLYILCKRMSIDETTGKN